MSLLLRSTRLLTLGTQLAKSNLVQNKQFSISLRLAQLKFTNQHEWVKVEGNVGTIGITDYAQDKLGEVVYLELPEVGAEFEQSNQFATLESVKAVSECYIPVSGKVVEVNSSLSDNPSTINSSPLDEGWLAKVELANPAEIEKLMDQSQYEEFLKSDDH
ncbi:glycine cleavage system H mitochondrial-like [Brachionus plicatilis]|uniref:Glycine cleavage system H protein n=1 Tax=Brachionus plicatilis TaxID=10195 RepID=A0A3M7PEU6_BRAPC|nr:glycine cleavage system H mitochondrial-like [Brachionus plicatilis]